MNKEILARLFIFDRMVVNSMEIVEVNPILDDRNCTAIMAVEIATRILGKKLY